VTASSSSPWLPSSGARALRDEASIRAMAGELMCTSLPVGADQFLQAIAAAVGGRSATYISCPIRSGSEWLMAWERNVSRGGARRDMDRLQDSIIAKNRDSAAELIVSLRRRGLRTEIIDPSRLGELSWTQLEFRRFWAEVISRFAASVVFARSWEFSAGCVWEFIVARAYGGLCETPLLVGTRLPDSRMVSLWPGPGCCGPVACFPFVLMSVS
jgi:hypothetical protein